MWKLFASLSLKILFFFFCGGRGGVKERKTFFATAASKQLGLQYNVPLQLPNYFWVTVWFYSMVLYYRFSSLFSVSRDFDTGYQRGSTPGEGLSCIYAWWKSFDLPLDVRCPLCHFSEESSNSKLTAHDYAESFAVIKADGSLCQVPQVDLGFCSSWVLAGRIGVFLLK